MEYLFKVYPEYLVPVKPVTGVHNHWRTLGGSLRTPALAHFRVPRLQPTFCCSGKAPRAGPSPNTHHCACTHRGTFRMVLLTQCGQKRGRKRLEPFSGRIPPSGNAECGLAVLQESPVLQLKWFKWKCQPTPLLLWKLQEEMVSF